MTEPLYTPEDLATVNSFLANPHININPRRSKFNANCWWHYIDGNGNVKQNIRQYAMMCYEGPEALFGGQAGGGKSFYVLMDALRYFDVPNYCALILRRTWNELSSSSDALINVALEVLAPFKYAKLCEYNVTDRVWTSNEGGRIQFAHAENAKDIFRFQGTAFQRIYFDEIGLFEESQYNFMFRSQRRRKDGLVSQVPVVMRATANPGGAPFVRQRFVQSRNKECVFIASGLNDNPFIDAEDYRKKLEKLPDILRRQLLEGDWDVMAQGGMIDRSWFEIVSVMPPCKYYVRAWDQAGTVPGPANNDPDWTVGTLMGYDYSNTKNIYIDLRKGKFIRVRRTSGEVERMIEMAMAVDGDDVLQVIEQQPGATGKSEMERLRKKWFGRRVRFIEVNKSKEERIAPFVDYAYCKEAKEGHVKIVSDQQTNVDTFLNEITMFPQKGVHDDCVDTLSSGFRAFKEMTTKLIIRSGSQNSLLPRNSTSLGQLFGRRRF